MRIPWKTGGIGALLPEDKVAKPIGGSRIDFVTPIDKYIPKIFFAPTGSGYICWGMNLADKLFGDEQEIATLSKKQLDERLKKANQKAGIAKQLAIAGAHWDGASKKPMCLGCVNFDVALFVLLQGKYKNLQQRTGEKTGVYRKAAT